MKKEEEKPKKPHPPKKHITYIRNETKKGQTHTIVFPTVKPSFSTIKGGGEKQWPTPYIYDCENLPIKQKAQAQISNPQKERGEERKSMRGMDLFASNLPCQACLFNPLFPPGERINLVLEVAFKNSGEIKLIYMLLSIS